MALISNLKLIIKIDTIIIIIIIIIMHMETLRKIGQI